jgi:hypothetical protein
MWERVYSLKRNIGVEEVWGELKACYRALCIKCLAFSKDGGWLNIKVTGFLSRKSEDQLKAEVMQEYGQLKDLGVTRIDKLLITFDVYNADRFLDFVKQLSSGAIIVRGERVRLGENVKIEILPRSHLYSREPYSFPRISLAATSLTKKMDSESIQEIEEELKECGYTSLNDLGPQWLMLPDVIGYTYDVLIDFPIYFLPMSVDLSDGEVIFRAICHKALAQRLKLRVTLKRRMVVHEIGYVSANYVPEENYMITLPEPSEELGEVKVEQPFKSSLRREDIVECAIVSKLGVVAVKSGEVERILQKEISGDFPKLVSQFITLDKLRELLESRQVGGVFGKKPDLAFQRVVVWLFSILGFQVAELEGTNHKILREENGTQREVDVLMCDPQTKKLYVIDVTLRSPEDKKIDDIANLKLSLQRRGVFVEPMIVVGELATEKKRNVRNIKILDYEDLQNILEALRRGEAEEAKRLITR